LLPAPSPPKGRLALAVGQEVVQRLSQREKTVMEAPHPYAKMDYLPPDNQLHHQIKDCAMKHNTCNKIFT
jgi:hypothetical protein